MSLPAKLNGHARPRAFRIPRKLTVLQREELAALRAVNDAELEQYERPRTRGDCEDGERPCPYVSCRYHLQTEINPSTGSVKFTYDELEKMSDTCELDVSERGAHTLEQVAELLNVTRERVRQVEERAIQKLAILLRRDRMLGGER